MTLPVADTLKLILGHPAASARIAGPTRLDRLFAELRAHPTLRRAHEIEEEIWALWTSHDDPALEARMQRAIATIGRRRFDEAEALLDALVLDAPDWAETWNKRATLYYLTERDAESLADIRRTLEQEPRHFGAICGFGQICMRQGETMAAASAFAAALDINPHMESVRAVLATLEPAMPQRLN